MSVHIIVGECGSGKSSLMAAILAHTYKRRGEAMRQLSCDLIRRENAGRKKALSYPKKVPIYTVNFDVKLIRRDGSEYSPYSIEGRDIGISGTYKVVTEESTNDKVKEKYKSLYPASAIFVDEAQGVFNSKQLLPRGQSLFFEEHRHSYLDVYLAAQRGKLINKDIRGVSTDFMHVLKLEHELSIFGRIRRSVWHFRKFESHAAFETYIDSDYNADVGGFTEGTYEYVGNVFELYDSHARIKDFLPKGDEDFAGE